MLRFVVLSALVAVAFGGSLGRVIPTLDGRIVGGEDTSIEEYPHQLSLEIFGRHSCGASIISANKVLTAAHCTHELKPSYMKVRAGITIRESGGQLIEVVKICQHPEYSSWNFDKDVSVLILAEDIELGPTAQPIELIASGEDVEVGTVARVTGWGAYYEGGFLPAHLQVVEVPRISEEVCTKYYGEGRITENMICFGYDEGKKDSCQGDSGGPLVADGKQVGVVSWGYGCARPKLPGVYSRIAALREHIDSC